MLGVNLNAWPEGSATRGLRNLQFQNTLQDAYQNRLWR